MAQPRPFCLFLFFLVLFLRKIAELSRIQTRSFNLTWRIQTATVLNGVKPNVMLVLQGPKVSIKGPKVSFNYVNVMALKYGNLSNFMHYADIFY